MARSAEAPTAGDTIVASATAAAPAAIAIVRLSGRDAHRIAAALAPRLAASPVEPGRLVPAAIHDRRGALLDRALAVRWMAPHSATGEDVAELHLHGAPALVRAVIEAAVHAGARVAEPGEFTRRAYLNGRLDLASAESIAALAAARTAEAARAAAATLGGGLAARCETLRQRLVPLLAELDAAVDFSDQDVSPERRGPIAAELDAVLAGVDALLAGARRSALLRQGARVVLVGPPNAGKSSLFNALLRRERALVSPHPGTTRDAIEADIDLQGIPVTLVDTAGLRAEAEAIEALGIARTHEAVASATRLVLVADASDPEPARDAMRNLPPEVPRLNVWNKSDLACGQATPDGETWLRVSARTGDGIGVLEGAIAASLATAEGSEALLSSARQEAELRAARGHLARAQEALAAALSPEFISSDLAEAAASLGRVAPRHHAQPLDEEVLDAVFRTFCLGK